MVADLYIISESFANNAFNTNAVIEEKILALKEDILIIKKYDATNNVFVNQDIYNVNFLIGVTIDNLLNNHKLYEHYIGRDVYNALLSIVLESQITTWSSREVIEELLPEHNENICHGIIAFNTIIGIDETVQLIYGKNGWYNFRRYFLGLYPKNADFFFDECVKYFPELYFHERNRQTIKAILNSCPKKIIHYLSALNDNFNICATVPYNRNETLKRLNAISGFDQKASIEGNINKKAVMSFDFITDSGTSEQIYCEIHLKLLRDDFDAKSQDRRIYFHEGITKIQKGKILIGHIGTHK